ncbi:hypothetical protein [Microbacterium sp. JZ31]|uniref:hypothetical protein n=1 Tax=Microbacterium sp. JZ31 TaxID=1906274 RepID=UPI001932F7BD|nr:hypothetical protein [Microbacterium sp. JZ31]
MRPVRLAAPALVLAVFALAACQPTPDPTDSPAPTSEAPTVAPTEPTDSPEPSASATPTPSPTPTETPDAGALPASCEEAYSLQMQDWLFAELGALNPSDADLVPSSKLADLLDVIQGSPNLTCYWTPEGGGTMALNSNAAVISAEHEQFVRDALGQAFPGCDATAEHVRCTREGEQQEGTLETETVVLRGDVMLTTYAMNVDGALVQEAVDDMLAHLPQ